VKATSDLLLVQVFLDASQCFVSLIPSYLNFVDGSMLCSFCVYSLIFTPWLMALSSATHPERIQLTLQLSLDLSSRR
jgi:cytosine/uracil/thiamine/allantoin permease